MEVIALDVENLTDARYFAAMGTPYLGFTTAKTNSLPFEKIAAIFEWVSGSQLLLEFDSNDLNYIINYIDQLRPAAILVSPSIVSQLTSSSDIIKGIKLDCKTFLESTPSDTIDFIIVNVKLQDLETINLLNQHISNIGADIYFDFKMPLSLYKNHLNKLNIKGLIVKGGKEEQVGVKSFDEIDDIFDYIEEDE